MGVNEMKIPMGVKLRKLRRPIIVAGLCLSVLVADRCGLFAPLTEGPPKTTVVCNETQYDRWIRRGNEFGYSKGSVDVRGLETFLSSLPEGRIEAYHLMDAGDVSSVYTWSIVRDIVEGPHPEKVLERLKEEAEPGNCNAKLAFDAQEVLAEKLAREKSKK